MPSSVRAALVATLLATMTLACGAPCENVISAQRRVRDQKPAHSDGRAHAQLRFPHNRLNLLLETVLQKNEIGAELRLPSPFDLPTARADATRIEIRSAEDGAVGFYIETTVFLGDTKLLSLSAVIEARATAIIEKGHSSLEIGFDADSLRSVQPEYPAGALDLVAAALGPAIKAATGRSVPGPLLRPIARRLFDFITTGAFEIIRDQVLARVGEVARLRVDLGGAPIERIEVSSARSAQPALLINLWSTLPVRVGLAEEGQPSAPISGTGSLRIAGDTLAELANWAIAEGLAPQTYDSKLRPDPDGAYVPVYSWRDHELPLLIHAFRIQSPCSTILIGARPEVAIEDGTITVGVADGNVERVEGSSIIRLGVGLKSIFAGAIEKSETSPASASFEVGGQAVTARLVDAAITGGELDLTVELSVADPAAPEPEGSL